jgi:hypothetical protein
LWRHCSFGRALIASIIREWIMPFVSSHWRDLKNGDPHYLVLQATSIRGSHGHNLILHLLKLFPQKSLSNFKKGSKNKLKGKRHGLNKLAWWSWFVSTIFSSYPCIKLKENFMVTIILSKYLSWIISHNTPFPPPINQY